MEQRTKLKQEILLNESLRTLTRAYQEHALQQINFARFTVLGTRDFAEKMTEVFSNVRTSYEKALKLAAKKGKSSLKKKNGKEILVLITANNKLYGDLIPKICRLFHDDIKKKDQADIMLVGKEGRAYLQTVQLRRPFIYFDVPDTHVSLDFLRPLAIKLLEYDKVTVFCGKFYNLMSQEAIRQEISGTIPPAKEEEEKKESDYFYEPSLEELLIFFESQIFSLILNQTVQEAQLARFGARIQAMENAQNNLHNWLYKLGRQQRRLKNIDMNKKVLSQISGRRLWNKR